MAVQCTHCGATLIGAVNRCWQCGNVMSPSALVDADGETAVAKAVEGANSESNSTATVEPESSESAQGSAQLAQAAGEAELTGAAEVTTVRVEGGESADTPPRRDEVKAGPVTAPSPAERQQPGSPFAAPETGQLKSAAPPARYPQNIANSVGAVLAVILGVLALLEAPYVPIGAVLTALIGLACGVWGIKSNRRKSSTLGMFLCCIALAWGIFNATVELYIYYTDTNPFAPNTAIEAPSEEDELVDPFDDPNF